ncbi:MAG: hypothetical protein WBC15_05730 [Mycobacterium sp.]
MAAVTPEIVQELLEASPGSPGPVIPIITAMAKAYTRGRGFTAGADYDEPNDEIAAVIATASARMAANVRQTAGSSSMDNFANETRTYFQGWTVAELFVLNRYRKRAM